MPSITIRHVPDHTRNELAARAAAAGWSLQEYLLHELEELARRPDHQLVLRRIRERTSATGTTLAPDVILEHLHADRS